MASSPEDVPNEKSTLYDDRDDCDPDLEARLYAEIYHSNEAYKFQPLPSDEPATTSIRAEEIRVDRSSTDNFVQDRRPDDGIVRNHETLDIGKSYYPTNSRPSNDSCKILLHAPEYRSGSYKHRRLLTRQGLWSSPCVSSKNPTESPNLEKTHPPPNNRICADRDARNDTNAQSILENVTRAKAKRIRQKKTKRIPIKPFSGTKTLSRRAAELSASAEKTDARIFSESSKYKVISKRNKMKMRRENAEPVNISSDSDDSILEVPVPPKAPPVIIQLPDSDDEGDERSGSRSKKSKESRETAEIEVPTDSNRSDVVPDGITDDHGESGEKPAESPLREAEDELILNCTEVQRGASSLDEIRRIRAHSDDDSMTESEANNWGNIAAGQSEVRTVVDVCSSDGVHAELWNPFGRENIIDSAAEQTASCSVDRAASRVDEDPDSTTTAAAAAKVIEVTRKRQNDNASGAAFTDFDVPAIPSKRSKRIRDKSRAQSLTEYFFKPMSRELRAFYDNPWGGENMSLYDIQSRMPKNPKCWTILDADLRGAVSKRRRNCPRCKTDSHYGKRCPEKPKAPCCYMCGAKGHTESRCPHTMCLTCGRKYATYRPTCSYCSQLNCHMCTGSGHSGDNCPDLWRRYHNTVTETMPVAPRDFLQVMKPPQHLTCCNCAKRGHDVTMCHQLRWSQHFPTPIYVTNYTDGPFYRESLQTAQIPAPISLRKISEREQIQNWHDSHNSHRELPPREIRQEIRPEIRQEFSPEFRQAIHQQFHPQFHPEFQQGIHQQFQQGIHQQFQQGIHQQFQPEIHRQFQPEIHPQFQQAIRPEFQETIHPQFQQEIHPQFQQEIHPQFQQEIHPQFQQEIHPQFQQQIHPEIHEEIHTEKNIHVPIVAPPKIVFQCTNLAPDNSRSSEGGISRRLDTNSNLRLSGLLSGSSRPNFLHDWLKCFKFHLEITETEDSAIRMIIEAENPQVSHGLAKVMMQWLRRTEEDRIFLEYSEVFKYGDANRSGKNIGAKMLVLRTPPNPVILFQKITAQEEELRHMLAKVTRNKTSRKAVQRQLVIEKLSKLVMFRRRHLIASLYSGSWVRGGDGVVAQFHALGRRLQAQRKPKPLSIREYFNLIIVNNLIFAFHTSEKLSAALDKAISASKETNSVAPVEKPTDSGIVEILQNTATDSSASEIPRLADFSSPQFVRDISVIEDRGGEISEMPVIFGKTDSADVGEKSNGLVGAFPTEAQPVVVAKGKKVKKTKAQRGKRKKIEDAGLVRNLTKRNKKLYRSSAKEVIKLANLTNKPNLQKMAKLLKFKMSNGSVTTDDVHSLKHALGIPIDQCVLTKQQSQKTRNSVKNNDNNDYKKFVEAL